MTTAPTFDREALTEGVIGLMAFTMGLSDMKGALLMELVPERGLDLWLRFKTWRDAQAESVGLSDWLTCILKENILQVVYPKGCTLDNMTKSLFVTDIVRSGVTTNDGMLRVHFGINPEYNKARQVACKGCPQRRCMHWVDPHSSQRGRRPLQRRQQQRQQRW